MYATNLKVVTGTTIPFRMPSPGNAQNNRGDMALIGTSVSSQLGTTGRTFRFLSLPLELRRMIYKDLFPAGTKFELFQNTSHPRAFSRTKEARHTIKPSTTPLGTNLKVLAINRQVRQEAMGVLQESFECSLHMTRAVKVQIIPFAIRVIISNIVCNRIIYEVPHLSWNSLLPSLKTFIVFRRPFPGSWTASCAAKLQEDLETADEQGVEVSRVTQGVNDIFLEQYPLHEPVRYDESHSAYQDLVEYLEKAPVAVHGHYILHRDDGIKGSFLVIVDLRTERVLRVEARPHFKHRA